MLPWPRLRTGSSVLSKFLAILCLVAFFLPPSTGAEPAARPEPAGAVRPDTGRPRIGLVLSGGGARGLVHLGVLRALEDLHVPIDAIAGTSMGAVVGGLYASGLNAAQIEALIVSVDWADAFRDRPARRRLSFRRKQDDREFLVQLPLGIKGRSFRIPRGLIQGQKLNQLLRHHLSGVAGIEHFDDLPIPFRAVATDIETGARRVFDSGDLVAAMRASMSAPGVFAPVEIEGRLYADGGVVDNVPIDVARAMNVDLLIVVDVSAPLRTRQQLNSAFALSDQMITVMIRRQSAAQRATLTDRDIVIEPPVHELAATDFTAAAVARAIGAEAALQQGARLAPLSMPAERYAELVVARRVRDREPPRIDFVRVDAASRRYADLVQASLGPVVGPGLDVARVEEGVSRLYGDDLFESIDYRLVQEDGRQGLEFSLRRKSWGPNYVRFGLELQDNFAGTTSFNARARVLVTEVNARGGEWLTDLQVGENPKLFTELHQPVAAGSRWFVAPALLVESNNVPVIENDRRVAEYRLHRNQIGLDFGRELGRWGELRAGWRRSDGSLRLSVGARDDPDLPLRTAFTRNELFLRFSVDDLDSVYFPRRGTSLRVEWSGARRSLGGVDDGDLLRADWLLAGSHGRNTLMWWSTLGSTVSGPQTDVQNYFGLGGLFRLSGLEPRALSGPHYAITRGIFYRRIGAGGEGFLNVPAYLGASLELGNVWQSRKDIRLRGAHLDGALFLGLDTFLGPIYLAGGVDEDGGTAFYLLLGRAF